MELLIKQDKLISFNTVYSYQNTKYNLFVLDKDLNIILNKSYHRMNGLLNTIKNIQNNHYLVVACKDSKDDDLLLRLLKIQGKTEKNWLYLSKKTNEQFITLSYKTSNTLDNSIVWSPNVKPEIKPENVVQLNQNADAKKNKSVLQITIGMSPLNRLYQKSIGDQLDIKTVHYDTLIDVNKSISRDRDRIYLILTRPHILKKNILSIIEKQDLIYLSNAHNGRNGLVKTDKFNKALCDAVSITYIPKDLSNLGVGYINNVHLALATQNKKHKPYYIYPELEKVTSIVYVSEWKHKNTIALALNSIFAQSYPQTRIKNIIVLDPENTSNTIFMLESLAKKKNNLHVIVNAQHKGFKESISSVIDSESVSSDSTRYIVSTGNCVSIKDRFVNNMFFAKFVISDEFESIEKSTHILDKLSFQKFPKFKRSSSSRSHFYCDETLLTITKDSLYSEEGSYKTGAIGGYLIPLELEPELNLS